MKSLAAAFSSACLAASAASTVPEQPPPRPAPDLRQAVQQYDAGSGAAPRQLTAVERAELRRQLSRQVRPDRPLKQRKEP